jgi:selenocysteine lyase/cysteine desulfurase
MSWAAACIGCGFAEGPQPRVDLSSAGNEARLTTHYLDQAASSWPKSPAVVEAMQQALLGAGAAGRGTHRAARQAEEWVFRCRQQVAIALGVPAASSIALTTSGTHSLNLALHGLLRPGDHVVTSAAEHNSVLRPLEWLRLERNVSFTVVPCDVEGRVDVTSLLNAIRPDTRLVAMTSASNVTGAVQPIEQIASALQPGPPYLLLDVAQSIGYLPLSSVTQRAALIAAPGHKGLGGPLGTGFLYVRPELQEFIRPLMQGGTGSASDSLSMPLQFPQRLEAGNLNVPGLAGLSAAVSQWNERKDGDTSQPWHGPLEQLLAGCASMPHVRVVGPAWGDEVRAPVVSVTVEGFSPQDVSAIMEVEFGVLGRGGLHCAAAIHAYLGTEPEGTFRLSLGHATTPADVAAALDGLNRLAAG